MTATGWVVRGEEVLATAEIAQTRQQRRRGLIGQDCIDGAFVLSRCRSVHTFGMRVPIDIIVIDREGMVLCTASLRPRRVAPYVRRAHTIIEVSAGCVDRWNVRRGDCLEIRT